MNKPELGKVAVGDKMLVIEHRYRQINTHEVVVTKVGRVWIDLAAEGNRSYRMRLDTQNDGSQYSQKNRFVTQAQYEWEQKIEAARNVLVRAKINLDWDSTWYKDKARVLALAEFIRTYDEDHPMENS